MGRGGQSEQAPEVSTSYTHLPPLQSNDLYGSDPQVSKYTFFLIQFCSRRIMSRLYDVPRLANYMAKPAFACIDNSIFDCADLGPRSSGCWSGRLFPCILTGKGDPQNKLTRCNYEQALV